MNDDEQRLLTEDDRATLLRDIVRLALMVGDERTDSGADAASDDDALPASPAERLWLLESLLPPLTRAVYQISHAPSVKNVTQPRRTAPPERARHVRPSAWLDAARRGQAGRLVEESSATASTDTPENQAVKAFLAHLTRAAQTFAAQAAESGKTEMAQVGQSCAARLTILRRLHPFHEVADRPDIWRQTPTDALQTAPAYRQIAEAMRRWRHGLTFDGTLALPTRETWRLYEIWTLLRVLEALRTLGHAADGAFPPLRADRLLWTLATGAASRIMLRAADGAALRVFYNRPYGEPHASLSHTMLPDIVLERTNGATWVLDAKFKAYDAPGDAHDDIAQMHAYRDAIINDAGRRIVSRAWCVFVGLASGEGRAQISYGPSPAASLVGALRLRPGDDASFERLRDLLAGWLD